MAKKPQNMLATILDKELKSKPSRLISRRSEILRCFPRAVAGPIGKIRNVGRRLNFRKQTLKYFYYKYSQLTFLAIKDSLS